MDLENYLIDNFYITAFAHFYGKNIGKLTLFLVSAFTAFILCQGKKTQSMFFIKFSLC